jgi:23S rRNA U2552 (ribose-2'-O)-methylase RlmE/FtsJ
LCDAGSGAVIKTFQNSNFKSLKKEMELFFEIVQTYKPAASKNKSAETYLYGAR